MISAFAKANNLKSYQVNQFNLAYYQTLISSFEDLSTWSKDLRRKLISEIPFSRLEPVQSEESVDDGTQKVLFKTKQNNYIESVLIKEGERNTVCVSCMSGCPVGCTFCATGQMGFNQNLDENEILDQILYFARILRNKGERVTNIVYMGMGEPMLNLESVTRSIEILKDKEKFALSRRRITVSTSGYTENLEQFLSMKLGVKLAVSLHAPNQELREQIMPNVSKKNTLKDLFKVLDKYTQETNKRVTYEYVLLGGINDSDENAKELSDLLKNRITLVNLINYNESEFFNIRRSANTENFRNILEKNGINCTIRKSYGNEIKGACGQLSVAVEGGNC